MGFLRAAAVFIIIGLIVMLTVNIETFKEKNTKDPVAKALFRARRATGRKPTQVFGKCGGTHYGRTGWLASPNFPGSSYPALSSCNWTISVYPRMVIKFDFVFMDMEDAPIQKRGGCMADYLMIRQGPNEGDALVGGQRYCGYDTPFNSVHSKSNRVWVYFASDIDTEGHGFAVRWTATDPPTSQFDCDFEAVSGLCVGWEQDTEDQYDWTTHHGLTQSGKTTETGPTKDRTKGDELGTYAYTEASGRRKGDKAILHTPAIRVRNPNGQCFRFWYHMRGDTMGTLNVYKLEIIKGQNTTAELIFTRSGDQGKPWRRADINVTATTSRIKFLFEGVRGSSYKSDMAIDEIVMLRRPCPPAPVITTTTTTTTRKVITTRRPRRTKPTKPRRTTTTTTTAPFIITTPSNCQGEYKCKERGNCIPLDYLCDGVPDCVLHEDEEKCGDADKTTTLSPQDATWSQWANWAPCTVTCGGGRSERTRTCSNDESLFGCPGSSLEGMECNTNKCLKWNDWEGWGSCTKSCGGGIQTRGRTCDGGSSGQPGCIGPLVQLNYCNEHNCPKWGGWGQWSQCQVTCGNGTITRTRTCEGGQIDDDGCDGNSTESSQCTNPTAPACAAWAEWGEFDACTVTCGGGKRTRARECQKDGKNRQGCPGSRSGSEDCNVTPCSVPEWAEWGEWSTCTLTCDGGFHGRRRVCMFEGARASGCLGSGIESGVCNRDPCPADPCATSPCLNSGSCVTVLGESGLPNYVCACAPGFKGKICADVSSRICHSGVFARSAAGPVGLPMQPTSCAHPDDSCMVATVGAFVDGKSAYVDTAQCAKASVCNSLTCDDLKKTMPDYKVEACKIVCCDADLCNAAPLDLPPLPITTQATTTKTKRTTRKPQTTKAPRKTRKPKTTKKPSRTVPKPTPTVDTSGSHWSDWQSWQGCTHLCGNVGIRRRFRFCIKGQPGMPGCKPKNGMIGEEPCNRGLTCKPPTTVITTTAATTTTTTTTTAKPPPTTPKSKGPKWGEWSEWNQCTVTCGLGVQRRNRKCVGGRRGRKGCRGPLKQTQDCNDEECVTTTTSTTRTEATTKKQKPSWATWTNWEPCSVSCGTGKTKRTRECSGGRIGRRGCRGKKMENKKCETPCPSATIPAIAAECLKRNARRAQRNGRRCPLECSADSSCDSGKKCVCDGYCGKTCQDAAKKCINILASDLLGTIITCSNGINVGSKCIYSCQNGFTVRGNAAVFCQGNSKWTSQKKLPKCVALAVSVTTPSTTPVLECTFRYKIQDSCCGNKPYNSKKSRCCDGKVSNAGPAMTECCSTVAYDPRKKGCCGTKSYKISGFKCQDGLVVPKS